MGRVLHLCLLATLTTSIAMAETGFEHMLPAVRATAPVLDFAKKAAEEKIKLKKIPFLDKATEENLKVLATVLTHLKGRKELKEDLANTAAEYIISAIPPENFAEISKASLLSPLGLPTYLATHLGILNGAEPNQAQLTMVKALFLALEKAKTQSPAVDLEKLTKLFLEDDKKEKEKAGRPAGGAPPSTDGDPRPPAAPLAADAGDGTVTRDPRGAPPSNDGEPFGGGTPTTPGGGFPFGTPSTPSAGFFTGDPRGEEDSNDPDNTLGNKNPLGNRPPGGGGSGGGGEPQKSPLQPPQPGQVNAQYQSKGQPKYDPVKAGEPLKFNPLTTMQNQEPQLMPELISASTALARMSQTPRDRTNEEALLKEYELLGKTQVAATEAVKEGLLKQITMAQQQIPPPPPKVSRNVRLGQFPTTSSQRVGAFGQAMQAQPSQIQDQLGSAQEPPPMRGAIRVLKPRHRR